MQRIPRLRAGAVGLSLALASLGVQADDRTDTLTIGFAGASFNTRSDDLSGPPGTTPPGIKVGLKQAGVLALGYERRLWDEWSLVFQAGTPPVLKITAAGTASGLGQIASARIWYPTVLARYSFPRISAAGIRFHAGAGANYTFYTDQQVLGAYDTAVAGTGSKLRLESSWGPVVLLGAEVPIATDWSLRLTYLRYWIKTTARIDTVTPGVGTIERTVGVRADPDVLAFTLGYRF